MAAGRSTGDAGSTMTIGERIRRLRGKLYTQRELADAAGVGVDLIRKLEQGRRHTASIASLHGIARALDVDIADLLGKRNSLPSSSQDEGVEAIRRALTPVDDLIDGAVMDVEPLPLAEAKRTADYLWGAYWAGRYEVLGTLLPNALMQLRATLHAASTEEEAPAAEALARAYQAAGDTLVHLGHRDAAWLAIREALQAARRGDDPLLYAAMRVSVAWQLLVAGRYSESEQVAVTAAHEIEPKGDVPLPQMSAYGLLAVTAATATARAQKADTTDELLGVAGEMAGRLGSDRAEHQTTFGPAKVAMLAVDCHVVQEQFGQALTAAKALPRDAALPLASRARHLADVAYAHTRLGHDDAAVTTLLTMEQMAPDWIGYQTLPRQVVAELMERERRGRTPLRALAQRLGVTSQ